MNLKYGFKICLCIQNLKYLNCSYCGSGTVQIPTFFSFSHFWGGTALVRCKGKVMSIFGCLGSWL